MSISTITEALLGGALIGLAASVLMLVNGRVAGISGIFGGLLVPRDGDVAWRALFLAGVVVGGLALLLLRPTSFTFDAAWQPGSIVLAGLLVGVGTQLGNGCTSGHGVCGLSRGSLRSLVATITFMATGAITVFVVRHVAGGLTP